MDHLIHHPKVLILLVFSLLCGCVVCKDCDNVFPAMASHTFRYELLKSNNETLKKEVFSHYPHVTPTDESAWLNLLPRKILKEEEEFDWIMTYRKIKNPAAGFPGNAGFLKEVPLEDVKLDSGSLHWRGQQTNLEYLMMLDNDNLLWSFRNTAGLPTPGQPYGGWEAPTIELRGHFVGHYLSATARMWASTYNQTLKDKMTALVTNLAICQKQMGNGYLSAFPTELFDRVEALQLVWAPYYTIHKIMQGLLDQYTIARNEQAFEMVKWMVDYFYNRVQNVIIKYSIERHWALQNEETGGMNDLLYQLYTLTGDQRHLLLAHLFDKPCFLGVLAIQAEELSGFHANTHIAIVIGAQMRYEVIGDPLYKEIGTFFLNTVNSSHTYATGGTSEHEFWEDPKRLATTLTAENEESCSTYNMLKVSRHLFRWTKEMAYADYYERALTNGVLSIQRRTDPGIMIYMLPLQPGGSKAISIHGWGTKFDTFWCCYGTGIESFSKLGDSIYFEEQGTNPGLYIIQYISSSFKWKTGGILLHQRADPVVSWDSRLTITVWITPLKAEAVESTLNFRIPFWAVGDGLKVSLNDQSICGPKPGNFLPIRHKWTSGDNITMELPLSLRIEAIQDDRPEYSSIHAILYGPYLLAGFSIGDWDIQTQQGASLVDSITSIPEEYNNNLKTFRQESGQSSFVLTLNNGTINMETLPQTGTNLAAGATFRLISTTEGTVNVSSCEKVMLEPYNFPGLALMHQGKDQPLAVASASDTGDFSVFDVVPGLDGCKDTVSLESANQKGCYVYSYIRDKKYPGPSIKLGCIATMSNDEFNKAVSFKLEDGVSKYDPISFVKKGKNRNFLLSPLLSMRDESYTVYFNMTHSL